MKILMLIIGSVFALAGLCLTINSWYAASAEGKIFEGSAYAGPFLLIVGLWRIFASLSAITPPSIFRIVAVGIGIAAGIGNTSALKATYPGDQEISTSK